MALQQKITLQGSQKAAPATAVTHSLNQDEVSEITVRIRRKQSLDELLLSGKQISQEEYEADYGASQEDADEVIAFASDYNLTAVETDLARRTIIFSGTLANLQQAFEVELNGYTDNAGNQYRGRTGNICIPTDLKDIIEGVFGLDNRPVARPMLKILQKDGQVVAHSAAPAAFTADQLAKVYGFPNNADGAGQCIGIIELGGGYKETDLDTYFSGINN